MKSVLDDIFGEAKQNLETLCSYTEYICDKYEDLSLQKGIDSIELEETQQEI